MTLVLYSIVAPFSILAFLEIYLIMSVINFTKSGVIQNIIIESSKEYIPSEIRIPTGVTITWSEPWSFHTFNFDNNTKTAISYNPWDPYSKYRLSIFTNWHILEERICLFAIFAFIFLL